MNMNIRVVYSTNVWSKHVRVWYFGTVSWNMYTFCHSCNAINDNMVSQRSAVTRKHVSIFVPHSYEHIIRYIFIVKYNERLKMIIYDARNVGISQAGQMCARTQIHNRIIFFRLHKRFVNSSQHLICPKIILLNKSNLNNLQFRIARTTCSDSDIEMSNVIKYHFTIAHCLR